MSLWRKRFQSGPKAVQEMWTAVESVLATETLSSDASLLLRLALAEAATNVIEHGYGNQENQPVELVIRTGDALTLSLHDRCVDTSWIGKPVPSLHAQAASLSERGRGRAMIAEIATAIDHRKRNGGGNALAMTFEYSHLESVARELTIHV
jgi:anti-sigma regulatory factor (Ser/Thr protein kinase)